MPRGHPLRFYAHSKSAYGQTLAEVARGIARHLGRWSYSMLVAAPGLDCPDPQCCRGRSVCREPDPTWPVPGGEPCPLRGIGDRGVASDQCLVSHRSERCDDNVGTTRYEPRATGTDTPRLRSTSSLSGIRAQVASTGEAHTEGSDVKFVPAMAARVFPDPSRACFGFDREGPRPAAPRSPGIGVGLLGRTGL